MKEEIALAGLINSRYTEKAYLAKLCFGAAGVKNIPVFVDVTCIKELVEFVTRPSSRYHIPPCVIEFAQPSREGHMGCIIHVGISKDTNAILHR